MKKSTAVVTAVLAASELLAGCAGVESRIDSASDTSEDAAGVAPRGFEFASGFLEFGDFDPYAIGDDIFNPCTEITEEEFAAAGFEQMRYNDGNNPFSRGIVSCVFASDRDDAVGGFYGGVIDKSVAEERGLILVGYQSKVLPELYTLPASTGMEGACYSQIDTLRGAFGTYAGGSPRRITTGEACEMAIEYVERLFLSYGTPSDHD